MFTVGKAIWFPQENRLEMMEKNPHDQGFPAMTRLQRHCWMEDADVGQDMGKI
jgi:hypothetical protein